jgi:hypothetical protein
MHDDDELISILANNAASHTYTAADGTILGTGTIVDTIADTTWTGTVIRSPGTMDLPDGEYTISVKDGVIHSETKPAVISTTTDFVKWYSYGNHTTFDEWCNKHIIPKDERVLLKLQYDTIPNNT